MIIKLGIIGAGWIADKMGETLAGLKHPEVIPYAISSRSLSKAQAFAERWGFAKAYGSYEWQVLACKDALEKGLLESHYMPHRETVAIMKQMDGLRAEWGVVYPND